MIPLGVTERSVVTKTFDQSFDPALGVVRRSLRCAVEIDVELYFEAADVFFQSGKLLFDGRFVVKDLVSVSMFRQAGKLVIANRQLCSPGMGAARGVFFESRRFETGVSTKTFDNHGDSR
jgi:hypothetical protein